MKILAASDIHGSSYYCKKLIECIKKENPDRVVLLGDLLYHGPRNALPKDYDPVRTADMLNGIKDRILCIKGNCDASVDACLLEFPITAPCAYIYDSGVTVFATHGDTYNENNCPSIGKGSVLLYGHTHVPTNKNNGENIFWNPGSVSIPKNGSKNGYMIIENGIPSWLELI